MARPATRRNRHGTDKIERLPGNNRRELSHGSSITRHGAGRASAAHAVDVGHVAVAVVHGLDQVVAWNCVHTATAVIRSKIEKALPRGGLSAACYLHTRRTD